jgi:hypothetical protein
LRLLGTLRHPAQIQNLWTEEIPSFREAIDCAPPRQGRKELDLGNDSAA